MALCCWSFILGCQPTLKLNSRLRKLVLRGEANLRRVQLYELLLLLLMKLIVLLRRRTSHSATLLRTPRC